VFTGADCITDYAARRDAPAFLVAGSYTPTSTDITNESAYSSVALEVMPTGFGHH